MLGIVNVLKPPGMTSHDVVAYLRRLYGIRRVGHAGTLDPAAAGVLPVFIGAATRLIEYAQNYDKTYRAEITFGVATDTGDAEGRVIAQRDCTMPPLSVLEDCLASFVGEQWQVPPMYSAVKVAGRRLYELARTGQKVARQPRRITISELSLRDVDQTHNRIVVDVTCSKGTYIRVLCADIGQKCGCPTVLSFLLRTRVGVFTLAEAATLEEVARERPLLPPETALAHWPAVTLRDEQVCNLRQGRAVPVADCGSGLTGVYDRAGRLVAVGRNTGNGMLTPVKVLRGEEQQ